MKELSHIGKSIKRADALEKVTGTTKYGCDMHFPGILFGKVLRSKHAHARILHIDTAKASRLLGVKAIATGKDNPTLFGHPYLGLTDQPIFAIDKVRYIGDVVVAVAAVDEDTAEEALELIEVEYQELPVVFDPIGSMSSDVPLIHENLHLYMRPARFQPIKGSNICHHAKLRRGNVEQGFAESDFIFEDTFSSQAVAHCALEPHMAMAQVGSAGKVTVWVPNDSPHTCRLELAQAFQIPLSHVRIISPMQGGGFGGKGGLTAEPIAVALALKTNNKPVRIAYTREEEFTSTMVRHPAIVEMKTGVKKDGILWARQIKAVWDTGAYSEKGPNVCSRATLSAAGPYRIPHLHADGYCVYTNNPIAGAFRGFGAPQVAWAYESQMDIIAEKLKLDPLEFRLQNAFSTGDVSQTGQVLKAVGVKECLQKAASQIGWDKQKKGRNRGKGIACMHKWQGTLSSSALLKIDGDGTVILLVGTMEVGTGCDTILSQIVAEELGVPVENIKIAARDTDYIPYDTSTTASRSTFMMGNAVMIAANDAKEQLLNLASSLLKADRDNVVMQYGRIFVRSAPERILSLSEVALKALNSSAQGQVIGKGAYSFPPETFNSETGQGWESPWMYAAQAAEVEVDTETGLIKVHRIAAAHDVGKAINPSLCEGQIEGALATGLGAAVQEEILLKTGHILNPNFHDYKLCTTVDIPEISPILVEEALDEGPYGAKGLGEPALAPTAAAIANAVYYAVGVRIKTLPLTPERVLKALKEMRE